MKSSKVDQSRFSGIELLRIVAMFLVMVVHADFLSLGAPSWGDVMSNPTNAIARILIESLSIVCVNVFVMISGWFGIKFKVRRLAGLIFQVIFFFSLIYIALLLLGYEALTLKGIAYLFMLLPQNWFVKAYLLLYILSPILNEFCENVERKVFLRVLVGFYVFQTLYGWLFPGVDFFSSGYSTISFIGIYLLMQFIKRYGSGCLALSSLQNFSIYVVLSVINSLFYILTIKYVESYGPVWFRYVNPIVIVSSLFLFLTFYRMRLSSSVVDWLASSSFAVYLVHASPFILIPFYKPLIVHLYEKYEGFHFMLVLSIALLAIFGCAVLVDRVRMSLWKKFEVVFWGK